MILKTNLSYMLGTAACCMLFVRAPSSGPVLVEAAARREHYHRELRANGQIVKKYRYRRHLQMGESGGMGAGIDSPQQAAAPSKENPSSGGNNQKKKDPSTPADDTETDTDDVGSGGFAEVIGKTLNNGQQQQQQPPQAQGPQQQPQQKQPGGAQKKEPKQQEPNTGAAEEQGAAQGPGGAPAVKDGECEKDIAVDWSMIIEFGDDPNDVALTNVELYDPYTGPLINYRSGFNPSALAGTKQEYKGCVNASPNPCLFYQFGDETTRGIVAYEIKIDNKKLAESDDNFGVQTSGEVGSCAGSCSTSVGGPGGATYTVATYRGNTVASTNSESTDILITVYSNLNDSSVNRPTVITIPSFADGQASLVGGFCAEDCVKVNVVGPNAAYVGVEGAPIYNYYSTTSLATETVIYTCPQDYAGDSTTTAGGGPNGPKNTEDDSSNVIADTETEVIVFQGAVFGEAYKDLLQDVSNKRNKSK